MQKSFYGLSGVNLVMALNSTTRIIVFKPHTEFSGDFVENIVETHTCQKNTLVTQSKEKQKPAHQEARVGQKRCSPL